MDEAGFLETGGLEQRYWRDITGPKAMKAKRLRSQSCQAALVDEDMARAGANKR